jgi:transcriptional regulator with XRE-family HTH domain
MMERIGPRLPPKVFIREWIAHERITQERLSERMSVSPGTLSKLINGHMEWTPGYIQAAADAFDIDFDDMFRHPDRPTPADLLHQAVKSLPAEKMADALRVLKALTGT